MKTWLILLMVSCILGFTACSDDDANSQAPLAEIVMNNTASIGDIFTISGSGFDQTSAQIYFRNKNEEEIHIKELKFTPNSVQFKIPTELTPGKYTIVLKQNGTWTLGEITLHAMENPIKNIVYPTELYMGQNITIQGEGFNSTAKIYLENTDGKRTEALNIISMEYGLTCSVPTDLRSQSFYTIVLTQDGGEWKSETKAIALLVKRLTSIMTPIAGYYEYIYSEEEPWGVIDSNWIEPKENISEFIYDTQGRLTEIIEYTKENGLILGEKETTITFDHNTANQIKVTFHNSIEYLSGTFEIKDKQVISCTTLDFWEEEITYKWSYTEGYLSKITSTNDQNVIYEFTYNNDNNLTDITTYGSHIPFEYDKQNVYGLNVPLVLTTDIFIKCATYLGLTGKNSKNIPVKYYLIGSEDGININSTIDNDGYLTNLALSTKNGTRAFTYEVVQ